MIKKTIFLNIFFLLGFISIAQTGSIDGIILSEGKPVPYAIVKCDSINAMAVSDELGKFTLTNLPTGNYKLEVKRIGFYSLSLNIDTRKLKNEIFKIVLIENAIDIQNINIDAKRDISNVVMNSLDLKFRPVSSSQDLLRMVPGLFIAQHTGGGKAEQIFLRGFDVDHGTDFAIYVDGMPVNMTSHAHGQGYADLHFLIPETVGEFAAFKGPHNAQYGDLATAGAGEFKTIQSLDRNLIKLELGQFDTRRALGMFNLIPKNKKILPVKTESLILAGEYLYTNSFLDLKQKLNRYNLFTKYHAELKNGDILTVSMTSLKSDWMASGQIPNRKVEDGSLSRFGSIDPSEGGSTSRSNINLVHQRYFKKSSLTNQFYYNRYRFELYSNFTFNLNDSLRGDQIHQSDNRHILGYTGKYKVSNKLFKKELASTLGFGMRYDHSQIQLNQSEKRVFVQSKVRGELNQLNAFIYLNEDYAFSSKLILNLGLRTDLFHFGFKNTLRAKGASDALQTITNPKINLTYTQNSKVQFLVKSGFGFHSNDARVVVLGHLQNNLARAFGNEVGSILKPTKNLILNAAVWSLDLENELVYVGDEGIVEIAGRTRRIGFDFGFRYQMIENLILDMDININKGRLLDEAGGQNRIPLAPVFTSIGGITYKKQSGINGSIRYRYLADRPANEDNSITAIGYFLLDAVLNYTKQNYQIGLSMENILNTQWREAQFVTESKLPSESKAVEEIHFTPGTPFFAKLIFSYNF